MHFILASGSSVQVNGSNELLKNVSSAKRPMIAPNEKKATAIKVTALELQNVPRGVLTLTKVSYLQRGYNYFVFYFARTPKGVL